MSHVQWWLLGLAFLLGLGLTLVLLARPVRRRIATAPPKKAPQWPSTDATAAAGAEEFFTTQACPEEVAAEAEHATTSPGVEGETSPTTSPAQDVFATANTKARDDYAASDAAAEGDSATSSIAVENEPAPEMPSAPDTFATTTVQHHELAATADHPAGMDYPTTKAFAGEGLPEATPAAEHVFGRHERRVEESAGAAGDTPAAVGPDAHEEPATAPPAETDFPTTEIPAAYESAPEAAATSDEPASGKSAVERDSPTATIPTADELPTTVIPVAQDAPEAKRSFFARFRRKKTPPTDARPTTKITAAKQGPTAKVPAAKQPRTGKRPPQKKVPPAKGGPAKKASPAKGAPAKKAAPAKLWPEKKGSATQTAPAKKVGRPKVSPRKSSHQLPYEPFGPGSARATLAGGGPAGWFVKGRTDTRLYYTPGDAPYELTVAQVWFKDEKSAARALFTPWSKSSKKR